MKKTIHLLLLTLTLNLTTNIAQATDRLNADTLQPMLKQLVDEVILPGYAQLDKQAQQLRNDAANFCSEPNAEGLQTLRASWSKTLSDWQQNSALVFGPALEDQIDFTIYFRPVKKAVIKTLLKTEVAITPAIIKKAGAGGQGLATLEYLLYDRDMEIPAIVTLFADDNGKQRCHYLVSATTVLAENIQTIHQGWRAEGGKYGEALYNTGKDSPQFAQAYQPLELLINHMYQSIQSVEIKKLGVPLGLRGSRSGKPRAYPYKLEAWRSGHSWQNIVSCLEGLQQLFDTGGILDLLRNNGEEKLAQQLGSELKALLAIKPASTDLFQLLETKPDSMKPFYQQVRAFATTIRTGLAPALGVQLGFNQNDGD